MNQIVPSQAPDVLIIGGGIIGCALAYDLARQGAAVELLESQALAREASWASAGIILSAPWPDGAALTELVLLANRRYPALIAEIEAISAISTGWRQFDAIFLGTADSEAVSRERMRWQAEHDGREIEWLDEIALREREPAVHERFTCGRVIPGVAAVSLHRVAVALARSAQHHGAIIREYMPVLDIETSGGRATGVRTAHGARPAGAVIIAAGAWSRMFGQSIGFEIPTRPERGQMLAIADPPEPVNGMLIGGGIYIYPTAEGLINVGATAEPESGFDKRVTPAGIRWLTDRISEVMPSLLEGRLAGTWAGLRPDSGAPDGLPIIGKAPRLENVWIVTGHMHSGALTAAATSELVAASIVSGTVDPRLSAFDPARLDGTGNAHRSASP